MDGILLVNKPIGITSRDVVNIVSKKLKTKKIGHTGTLDPMAEGVLVLCIGKATKLVELLTNHDKIYEVEAILGIKTDTLDITGNILEDKSTHFSYDDIKNTFDNFPKEYLQQVPIYSAVKINGKKLYEYARNNEQVELPSRMVNIYELNLLETLNDTHTTIKFKTHVSKGTYIRSLVNDISVNLNTNGIMSKLKRIKQGKYKIEECYTLDDIENDNYKILTIEEVLSNYNSIEVNDELYNKIKNGSILENIYNEDLIIFTKDNKIISIYKPYKDNLIKPYQMFI